MILVTGGAGFIGSHLVERLVRSGQTVRALVLYDSLAAAGWIDALPERVRAEVDVRLGDVRDPDSVREALSGCSRLAHLAALIGIPYSYAAPRSYVDTNVTGTLNVLQAARELELERVVAVSTSEVYGTARSVPMTEDHPLAAQSPYAATKIAADQLALAFHRSFGLPVTIVRPFNTYGPRQSARAVIPSILAQIAAGQRRLRLGALHPTRDFTYVTDTAAGLEAALVAGTRLAGEVIQLGSGVEISIGELVTTIADVLDVDLVVEEDARRVRPDASEVERLFADASRARDLLGWKPEYAGLEGLRRGLQETALWFARPENLQRYHPCEYAT